MSHDEREFVSTGEPHASSPFSSARHPQGLSVNAKITGRIISKVVSLHEKRVHLTSQETPLSSSREHRQEEND